MNYTIQTQNTKQRPIATCLEKNSRSQHQAFNWRPIKANLQLFTFWGHHNTNSTKDTLMHPIHTMPSIDKKSSMLQHEWMVLV